MSSLQILVSSSFLLYLLICSFSSTVHGGERKGILVAGVDSLFPAETCSTSKGSYKNSLKIAHRYGPCSPLSGDQKSILQELLLNDQLRVDSIQQRLIQLQASDVSLPARGGSSFGTGNYIVTVGIGTPKKNQTVEFDTGSSVCWVQCRPCAGSCYPQQEPIFDPSGSSTYRRVPCGAAPCNQQSASSCSTASNSCLYSVQYGDNASTGGFLSQDTLTLTATDVFENFVFGCGQNNTGLFGETAGLFGLGRDPASLVSQVSSKYGKVFSYCLPATDSSTGDLNFGPAIGNSISYTPMLTYNGQPSFYALSLTRISVNGEQLPISPTVFSTSGTIIDSGTIITRLPPSAYDALRTAFRKGMGNYTLTQPGGGGILDTCYDLTGQNNISVPDISLQFGGGATLDLDIPGILIADNSQVCLAFAGNSDATSIGIIGNSQQRGREVVYDLGMKQIGFGPAGTCSS